MFQTLAISDEVADDLEKKTRSQSSSDQWHKCRAGKITTLCTWFKSKRFELYCRTEQIHHTSPTSLLQLNEEMVLNLLK